MPSRIEKDLLWTSTTSTSRRLLLAAFVLLPAFLAAAGPNPDFQPPADIAFTATLDQTEQRYILMLPQGYQPGEPRDLLIALHGHGADRWQFATHPRDECRATRDAAAEHGMILVSPDYRAKTSWMGPAAEADLLQIIGDLKKAYPIRHTILAGGSMGATSALTFTALHPDLIQGVVALNGTANHLEYEQFQEAIAESFGGTKQEVPEEYYRRSAEYFPLQFTMPVALTTGGQDTSVPPDSVTRLAAILQKLNPMLRHIHRPDVGHATNYEDTRDAIKFVLERQN